MESNIYACSDAVTTIDRVFYDIIVGRFKDPSKLHIIPNFVDTDVYKPIYDHSGLDTKLFPETDSLKVLYAGNIGLAQDWDTLIELAKMSKDKNIDYFIIGEGAKRPYLEESVCDNKLERVHILPYQNRELMSQILDYSDVHFIFMEPTMDLQGFPSKVYTVMACGRPLLVCSGPGTPIVNFLFDKNCAHIITSRDKTERAEDAHDWLKSMSRESLRKMGSNGRSEIESNYSKEIVTGEYVSLIDSLIL